MLAYYSKLLDVIEKVINIILVLIFVIMIGSMSYQIILRYLFNNANAWSEELARYSFCYLVFLGSGIAVRKNRHLQVDVIINLYRPKYRHLVTALCTALGIVFLIVLIKYSISLSSNVSNVSAGLGIPIKYIYSSVTFGGILMLLFSIEIIALNIKQFLNYGKNFKSGGEMI